MDLKQKWFIITFHKFEYLRRYENAADSIYLIYSKYVVNIKKSLQ